MPTGFRLLYRSLAPFVDPEPLSKLLPYLLFALTLTGSAMAASRLGGPIAAFLTAALVLQSPALLPRIVGGMPRGFGMALVPLGIWAATAGRVRWLGLLVVLAQAFYSVATALLGLMLGALLFLLPSPDRGEAATWSFRRRVAVLALVGSLAAIQVVPIWSAMHSWGRLLGPEDAATYPEIGRAGRHGDRDGLPLSRNPVPGLLVQSRLQFDESIEGAPPLLPAVRSRLLDRAGTIRSALLAICLAGLVPLAKQSGSARRALCLLLAGGAGFVLATLLSPYLYVPQRYLAYAIPIFTLVVLPASGGALAGSLAPARWTAGARAIGAALVAGGALVALGGRGDSLAGYTIRIDPHSRIYAVIRSLPKDALVAGWPTGTVNDVPYVSRRRAFLTVENHLEFNETYVLEMRRRMDALVAALLGPEPGSLVALRERFGVTHLVVDTNDFLNPPAYFAPFGPLIERTWREGSTHGFAAQSALARASIFRQGTIALLDLSRL